MLRKCYSYSRTQATVAGLEFVDDKACREYLEARVAPRVFESEATAALAGFVEELGGTGFDLEGLREQVESPPPPKDWEVGEVVAEVLLEDHFEAEFPWATTLDKRTPSASLQGPDIAGFHGGSAFVFGEVKSSSDKTNVPPSVVTLKNDGLLDQLLRLLQNPMARQQLIGWLLVRSRGTEWESTFGAAAARYFGADVPAARIYGVLVSGGREAEERDLVDACDEIDALVGAFSVDLVAIYLPLAKSDWVAVVQGAAR